MKIFVWRLPKPNDRDDPRADCDLALNEAAIAQGLKSKPITQQEEPADAGFLFVHRQLFTSRRLRQGWGIPTLDLRLPTKVWVENYIIAAWRYWGAKVEPGRALGRRRILECMLEMQPGDVILLPKIGREGRSDEYLTVTTVSARYYFEDRSQKKRTHRKDFGHVIGVSQPRVLSTESLDLPPGNFGAPYLRAIAEVRSTHVAHDAIVRLVREELR
jgi:hypothetical protein